MAFCWSLVRLINKFRKLYIIKIRRVVEYVGTNILGAQTALLQILLIAMDFFLFASWFKDSFRENATN